MTIGALKNQLKGMLEKELVGDDSAEVTQEIVDNLDVAVAAILENAMDEDLEEEDEGDGVVE